MSLSVPLLSLSIDSHLRLRVTLLFILNAVLGMLIKVVSSVDKIIFAYVFLLNIDATGLACDSNTNMVFYFLIFFFSTGEKLCSAEDCILGTGVYLRHGYIHSSLAGLVIRKKGGKEVSREVLILFRGIILRLMG